MKNLKKHITLCLLMVFALPAIAQEVNTLWWVENAPFRHYMNPAAEPLANIYISLPVLGYTSMYAGNNRIALNDVIFNNNGQTITALHPDADRKKLLKKLKNPWAAGSNASINLLAFGFRFKEYNYFHFGITQRIETETSIPRDLLTFVLDGGVKDLEGINTYNFKKLAFQADTYTEIAFGYSRNIKDKWTVGGKVKLLLGQGYADLNFKNLNAYLSPDDWKMQGRGTVVMAAAPLNRFPLEINRQAIKDWINSDNYDGQPLISKTPVNYLTPQGYGAAFDLGFVYKPIKYLQISAAVTDLGFIYWRGQRYGIEIDATHSGTNTYQVSDYFQEDDDYDAERLFKDIAEGLEVFSDSIDPVFRTKGATRMTSAKLNVGIDGKFWDGRVGVGLYSRTRYFNHRFDEELTLGAYFQPVHWFNLSASYSFFGSNGRSMGAALSIITYEGLGLTLAMDYIPFTYASAKK
ncbi:MAG: hypothetical protein IJ756_04665, partial [Paludibacteraceae bacterium]|nr:hypothetical protein [Paludibacteraceae bacterium]